MTLDEYCGWIQFLNEKEPAEPLVDLAGMGPEQLAQMFGGDA